MDDGAGVTDEGQGHMDEGRDDVVFTLGSSRKVRMRDSEAELTRLWETASDEARTRGAAGIMRLRELNLVIYAAGEAMADLVSGVISRLSQRHPARAIVLLHLSDTAPAPDAGSSAARAPGGVANTAPGAPTVGASGAAADAAVGSVASAPTPAPTPSPPALPLEAWVTAACYQTHDDGRHVCWEQVTVPARGEAAGGLHAAAMSLLVPDLPTVFWWPGQPEFESHTFRRLGEASDVVVIDSAAFPDPIAGLSAVARVAYDGSRNYSLADLNWSRLTPWRDMTAEFFDDSVRRTWLSRISRVEIEYGGADPDPGTAGYVGHPVGRALLFAGWLSSRLGWVVAGEWQDTEGGDVEVRLQQRRAGTVMAGFSNAPEVTVVMRRRDDRCGPLSGLVGVTLQIRPEADGLPITTLSVVQAEDGCVSSACVMQEGEDVLIRTFDITPLPEDLLLAEELDYLGADPQFEESLLAAASLAALRGSDRFRT